MDAELEYLLSFLEEEFSGAENVRVRLAPIEKRLRSPDLVQNFDDFDERPRPPRGVIVRAGSREYFFPVTWVAARQFSEIRKLAQEIKDSR